MNRKAALVWLVPLAAALSCAEPSPVGVDSMSPALVAATKTKPPTSTSNLVQCTPLPYDSVTQVIGPAGGVLFVGRHGLWVDSLALTSPVTITAVAPSDTVSWVRFRPDGLVFQPGARGVGAVVATNLDGCKLRRTASPRIAHVTDALSVMEYLEAPAAGVDSLVIQRFKMDSGGWTPYVAFGKLQHFSNYAVAW